MARGAYDTTGVPKPGGVSKPRGVLKPRGVPKPRSLPQQSAANSPADQAHEPRAAHQVPAPEEPRFLDLLSGPMDIDPTPRDDVDRNGPSQDEFSTSEAVEPQMSRNADLGAAAQSSDESLEDDAKSSRPSRFTEDQKFALDQWMTNNHSTPYPTSADKEYLAQATDLSTKQIQQYFSNYRRRYLEKSHLSRVASVRSMQNAQESSSQSGDIEMEPASVNERPAENSPRSTDADAPEASIEAHPPSHQSNRSSYSPSLEQSNVPDVQHRATESQGLATPSFSRSDDNLLQWWLREQCDFITDPRPWKDTPEMPPPPSQGTGLGVLTFAASGPSIATRHSADDVQSTTGRVRSANASLYQPSSSVGTFTSRGSRRGRRAYGGFHKPKLPSSNVKAAHECEQCGNAFKTGYTLKRHVQSVHESNERWVCAPVVRTEASLLCPTCLQDPLSCGHGMLACWEKAEGERTFYRKDLLKQHLILVHDFGSDQKAEDGENLVLLGLHQSQDGSNATVQRIGAPLVKAKSACYEWAFREHGLSREMFESYLAQAWRRAFELESNAESTRESVGEDVTKYCLNRLRDVIDTYYANGQDAG